MAKNRYYYKGMTLKDYCRENDLTYITVIGRIHSGITMEEAIKPKLDKDRRKHNGREKTAKAVKYKGIPIRRFCAEHVYKCYSYIAALRRYRTGMTIEQALFGGKYKDNVIC